MSEEVEHIEEDLATPVETEEGESEEVSGEETEEISEEENESAEASSAEDPVKSRAAARVSVLVKRAKEAEERAIRAEAIAAERDRQKTTGSTDAERRRQREEQLALMDPTERREFETSERLQAMEQQVLLAQLRTEDALDRGAFQSRASSNPVYARHQEEVERRLAAERNLGRNWPRETILAQIIGEAALKTKPNTKSKNEAAVRVASVKSAPVRARSDSTAYRPSRGAETLEDLERRLENVTF